jgi:hydrogenase nickel incorporation protein HypA/HybF
MHEYALAEAVVESVRQHIEEQNAQQIGSVTLSFGELQNINEEVFREGLRQALQELPFEESQFHIVTEKASFHCNYCGSNWGLDSFPDLTEDDREAIHFLPESAHVYLECPHCTSKDFSIEKGRGVSIQTIELYKESE